MLIKISCDTAGMQEGLDAIEQRLTRYGIKQKELTRTLLASEEMMMSLISHADGHKPLQLSVKRFLGDITIEFSTTGGEYDYAESLRIAAPPEADDIGKEAEDRLRAIILRSFVDDLKYVHRRGVNMLRFTAARSGRRLLYQTLVAMLLAVVVGVLLKSLAPEEVGVFLDHNVLTPIKTMFMNGLKMVVAPVVFFSIVSCIGHFGSLSEMGRVGGRVMAIYLITTLIATGLGIGTGLLYQPVGSEALDTLVADASAITSQTLSISLVDTVVGIVPNNIVRPFLESNMLQLIFLAVICGIAVGMIGKYSKMLNDFFSACNDLFLKITVLLVKFMPIAAFCSICAMIVSTGTQALLSVLGILLFFLLALVGMMLIYGLMLLLLGRITPLPFYKKYAPTMLQVFSMASSNASLPLNMNVCEKKLGISPKVYSLSIPLGATMNMDGTCLYLGVFALSIAKMYGVEITGAALLSVIMSIIVLSVGAPGIPGSGMICLSVLLPQLGVPVEAVGLVMGIDPLIGMLRSMSNCLGDVSVSTIVAKQEKLLDVELYKRKL